MKIRTSFMELPWFWTKFVLGFGLVIFLFVAGPSQAVEIPKTCPAEPTDMPIQYGDAVDCTIDSVVGDQDLFRFSGNNGDKISIFTVRPSGGVEPCIELFAPDGTSLETDCTANQFFDQFRIERTLDATGNYTIRIHDGGNNDTGAYHFTLDRLFPLSTNADPIQYGDSLSEIVIDFIGDNDLYFFQGSTGDSISIQTVRPSGGVEPCIELFAPDGTSLETDCTANQFFDQFRIERTLDATGNYTIRIHDGGNNDTGPYNLLMDCIVGSCNTFPEPLVPSRFENISTRGYVGIGHEVMIAGFIIRGDTNVTVLIRARGPSVSLPPGTTKLANPNVKLFSGSTMIASNDDWQLASNWEEIEATGRSPSNPLESAILITLSPGAYTAIVNGADGGVGVGIVEVIEIND